MTRSRLALRTAASCLRLLSCTVAGVLALGCEPIPGSDTTLDDSAVEPGPGPGNLDAHVDPGTHDAAHGGNDAANSDGPPPAPVDASRLDAGASDSGSAADAQGLRDASQDAGGDAAAVDAGDAAAGDAAAALDAGHAAADAGDAAALDAGHADAGDADALDAGHADADAGDAAVLDAGHADAGDAAALDAGQLVRARSGEISWGIKDLQGSLYCPQQSILLWKDETITLNDPSSHGFTCDICPNPPADDNASTVYTFRSDELEVRFDFQSSIARGYSLEGFRQGLRFVTLMWKTAPKSTTPDGWTAFSTWSDQPSVEFLAYEAPLLHARLQTVVYETAVSFNEPATLPYLCFHQTQAGPVPDICTEAPCGYMTSNQNAGVHVTVDITLPMQAPHEGLSDF